MYNKNRMVVWPVAALLALEFGVNAWLLSHGTREHNSTAIELLNENVDGSNPAVHHIGPRSRACVSLNVMFHPECPDVMFPACTMVFEAKLCVTPTTEIGALC